MTIDDYGGLRELTGAFFSSEKNQKTLSYSNLEVIPHYVVEDSVVKWARLILSEIVRRPDAIYASVGS